MPPRPALRCCRRSTTSGRRRWRWPWPWPGPPPRTGSPGPLSTTTSRPRFAAACGSPPTARCAPPDAVPPGSPLMDWATVASLATAAGTLVLAVATFVSVRSANRAARTAERTLLAGIRPLLVPSRAQDPEQKIGFVDNRWIRVAGGRAATEVGDDAVYLVMSLRNVGSGLAVLHGWRFYADRQIGPRDDHAPLDEFHRLGRDIYIP